VDNLLAIFKTPEGAAGAAIDMQLWLRRRNESMPDAEQLSLCMGLHHGKVLRLKDNVYGGPGKGAGQPGGELGRQDEILVTHKAERLLPASVKRDYARSTEIGGRTYELYKVRY